VKDEVVEKSDRQPLNLSMGYFHPLSFILQPLVDLLLMLDATTGN
jgi:hypothetical protein